MADAEDTKKQEDSKEEKPQEKTKEKTSSGGILHWIIMAVAVLLFACAGFLSGRLFTGPSTPQTAEASEQDATAQVENIKAQDPDLDAGGAQKAWYYDLEPVVANLDEPGVTRYVRATLILEMSSEVDAKKAAVFLEEKKPILTNWLTIYLASLNLESIRGDRNLKRIQSQVLDGFNERLFPDAKPRITHILFKEFAVQ
jgi:flagellar basal body-associated protein FliL